MTIEEEIKALENALSGALLVPSECAFVDTQVIKICLDTLKTYESWENLIRYEVEKQIREDAIEEFAKLIHEDLYQLNHHQVDFLAEQVKEQSDEKNNNQM